MDNMVDMPLDIVSPITLAIPVFIGLGGVLARWLTPAGGVVGIAIGIAASVAGWRPALSLLIFFVVSSAATKIKGKYLTTVTDAAGFSGSAGSTTTAATPSRQRRLSAVRASSPRSPVMRRMPARVAEPATPIQVSILRGRYKGQSGVLLAQSPAKTLLELPSGQQVNLMSTSVDLGAVIATTAAATHGPAPVDAAAACNRDDVRKGRGAMQVAAVGLVPALCCVALSPRWIALHGWGGAAETVGSFELVYTAYLACCCADTLASELGAFSARQPLLLVSLQPVAAGTDGAISFEGLVATVVGSALVASPLLAMSTAGGDADFAAVAFAGILGCLLDSVLGCLLQPAAFTRANPALWKPLNSLVNFLSASMAAGLVFVLLSSFARVLATIVFGLFFLTVAPIAEETKRNALHSGTGALILYLGEAHAVAIARTATVVAAVLVVTPHSKIIEHSANRRPGTILYSGIVAFMMHFYPSAAAAVLGSMFFADPAASVVGRLIGGHVITPTEADIIALKQSPKTTLRGCTKTLEGGLAFAVVSTMWMHTCGVDSLRAATGGFTLAFVELVFGDFDNLAIPLVGLAFVAAGPLTPEAIAAICVLLAIGLWRSDQALQDVAQAVSAYSRFARMHTVIGTTLSICVVSALALGPDVGSAVTDPSVLRAVAIPIAAALHMNVFIVGLNQMFDIPIDIINKPYLPVTSGEYSYSFGWALVIIQGIASVLMAACYGTEALTWTVVVSGVIGTVYSMPLGTLTRWKQFPLLAAMCIFSVRGVIVQIGFHEHMRMALPHRSVLPWSESTTTVFAVCFFTMYGVAIALFKDVPDILGDEQAGVRTAAVVLGARRVIEVVAGLFAIAYAVAALFWAWNGCRVIAAIHLVVGASLVSIIHATVSEPTDIRKSYMTIWKCFYLEYLILLLGLYSNQ